MEWEGGCSLDDGAETDYVCSIGIWITNEKDRGIAT